MNFVKNMLIMQISFYLLRDSVVHCHFAVFGIKHD